MHITIRFAAILIATLLSVPADAQDASSFKTEEDKLNYALGARIGRDLRGRSELEVKPDILFKGISDSLAGRPMLMSDQEIDAAMNSLRQKMAVAAWERAEKNRQNGAEFLAANKKREGVVTLKSGLQYKVLKQGTGPKPTAADRMVVNYRGTFTDGTEFDSSYARNKPTTIGFKQVIRGWREALLLMPTGSKWQLFVPPRLAYGTRGNGRTIGPNATLIFELELIDIKEKDAGNGAAQVAESEASNVTGTSTANGSQPEDLPRIVVSFRVDPSLMGGSYAQQGWVTPEVYQGVTGQDTVEAKVDGLDAQGRPIVGVKTEWIPQDPNMVSVSAGTGNSVKILIHRPGESNLTVISGDLSTTLFIKAESKDNVLQVEITQL